MTSGTWHRRTAPAARPLGVPYTQWVGPAGVAGGDLTGGRAGAASSGGPGGPGPEVDVAHGRPGGVAAQVAGLHPRDCRGRRGLLVQQRLDERPPGIAQQPADGHVLVPEVPSRSGPRWPVTRSSRAVSTSSSTGMRSAYAVGRRRCAGQPDRRRSRAGRRLPGPSHLPGAVHPEVGVQRQPAAEAGQHVLAVGVERRDRAARRSAVASCGTRKSVRGQHDGRRARGRVGGPPATRCQQDINSKYRT